MRQQFPLWLHVVLYIYNLETSFPQSRNNSFFLLLPSHQNLIAFKVLFWQEELLSLLQKFKTFEDPHSRGSNKTRRLAKKTKVASNGWCKVLHVCHVDCPLFKSWLSVKTWMIAQVSRRCLIQSSHQVTSTWGLIWGSQLFFCCLTRRCCKAPKP